MRQCVYVEKQLLDALTKPKEFQDKLKVAKKEVESLEDSVTKSIDNLIEGEKSQDISKAERRQLTEIKEVVIRVQNAEEIRVIAEEDITDPEVQKALGITMERFNPEDITLSEGVKERIKTLAKTKETLGVFYDQSTGKIFINENLKEEEIRPAVAREWKIKEDLEAGKGKENKEGKQRATVAGEIAYNEVLGRIQGSPSPIVLSKLSYAQMNPESEVTADLITPEDRKEKVLLRNTHIYPNLPDSYRTAFGGGEVVSSVIRGGRAYALVKVGTILLAFPEPATSVLGAGLIAYGTAEGAFAVSNAMEGSQEVYYGLTNQKEKVAHNPGKILLGEDSYLILDNVSASAMPYVSQTGEYAKVRGESVGKNVKGNLEKYNSLTSINKNKLEVIKKSSPSEANNFWKSKGYNLSPYDEKFEVMLVKNKSEKFVRVYSPESGSRKASAWFMREKDIVGLTPKEIKDKFALPNIPTHVVDVKLENEVIRTGVVKKVLEWGEGGGQQFDTNGAYFNENQFINERRIGEKYERYRN